jgi:hypothetical protein
MSSDGGNSKVQLFRLWVRKGKPFSIHVPGNPEVTHNGGMTLAPLVITQDQAVKLKEWLARQDCEADLLPAVQQSKEQAKERGILLGLNDPNRVFPSAECATCSWFDPLLESPLEPCGRAWWKDSYKEAFGASVGAQRDAEKCPVDITRF